MPCTIFLGDIGTVFKVTIRDCDTDAVVDLSTAITLKQLIFQKPDKTVVTQTAAFFTDGTDGILTYTSVTGDLDIAGGWSIQGHVEGVLYKNSSTIEKFTVLANL